MRPFPALLLITALASPLAAQKSSFGVVGGFVSSNATLDPNTLPNKSSRSGFAIGVTAIADLGGGFKLAPEALYVEKGASFGQDSLAARAKLTYIEIPVNFRYAFGNRGMIHPFLLAGPTISFNLDCKVSVTNGTATTSVDCDSGNPNGAINSTDIGMMFGGGIAGSRLSASVRYEIGFSNVSKDDTQKVHNRALFVMAGISF